jgi:hypothetical protein
MTRGAQAILAALDDLPATEREEVVSELLRRVALSQHAPPFDDELTVAAEAVFGDLDRRENSSH